MKRMIVFAILFCRFIDAATRMEIEKKSMQTAGIEDCVCPPEGLAPLHRHILKSADAKQVQELVKIGDVNACTAWGLSPLALLLTKVAAEKDERREVPEELAIARNLCEDPNILYISPFHTIQELMDDISLDDSVSRKELLALIRKRSVREASRVTIRQSGHTVGGIYYRHKKRLNRIEINESLSKKAAASTN